MVKDTSVRLVHSGLPDATAVDLHEQGWSRYLGRLVTAAVSEPGPDLA